MKQDLRNAILTVIVCILALAIIGGAHAYDTTGGTIYNNTTHVIHVFTGNGTFGINTGTPSFNAMVLVVGGGGGGASGGGSAGQVLYNTSYTLSTNTTVTIGSGGSAGTGVAAPGGNGTTSQFGTMIALNGVGGMYVNTPAGQNGYQGGGAARAAAGASTGGTGTSGRNGGGNPTGGAPYCGAGGAGAGTAGTSVASESICGNGGDGVISWINSSSVYYGGGGGGSAYGGAGTGGTGGLGGGGRGNIYQNASIYSGVNGTGGGGGGAYQTNTGGRGGDGIIIVSYVSTSISQFSIQSYDIYNSTNIITFNATITINGTTNNYTTTNGTITAPFLLGSGNANITIYANNYFPNATTNYNTSTPMNMALTPYTIIRANNTFNGAIITSFSVSYTNNANTSETGSTSTTNGYLYIPYHNASYNTTISSTGHSTSNTNLIAPQYLQSVNFSLYPNPSSVYLFFYDEGNGSLINGTTLSITTSGDTTEVTNTTTTGSLFIGNLTPGNYTLTISGGNYTARSYVITLGLLTNLNLNAYLATSTSTTILNLIDKDTGAIIPGGIIAFQRSINGTYVTVDSKISDVSGAAQLSYVQTGKYKIIITTTGYTTKTFYLDPVLFSSYNILLTKTTTYSNTNDYANIGTTYAPASFNNNANNAFTFTITAPTGILETYGYTLKYGTTTISNSSTNAYGSSLTGNITINNAYVLATANLTYWYDTTLDTNQSFTILIPINGATGNNTFLANINKNYGFGDFEKTLIATIGTIGVAGTGFAVMGASAGGLLGLFALTIFLVINFLTLYQFIIPAIIIVMILLYRSNL